MVHGPDKPWSNEDITEGLADKVPELFPKDKYEKFLTRVYEAISKKEILECFPSDEVILKQEKIDSNLRWN